MAININIPIEDAVVDGSLNPVTSNAVFDAIAAIPSTSGFVPYTGATNDVDLGVHDLTATQGTFATSGNPDTLTVNHSSGSGKALTITKGGSGEGIYVNKTSGSGNAVTVVGDLEATNIKRTGGTSAQFLKANGSIDSTSYQPTLVSATNIKTVNGNSLLGSGDLVISGGGGGIEVGTTAVTSGTIGRIFFQGTGDVVQQSASLFWDNTNARLGVGATPATTVRLDVRAQGALSTDIAFRVRNSADNANLFQVRGDGQSIFTNNIGTAGLFFRTDINGFSLGNSASGYQNGTGINVVNTRFFIMGSNNNLFEFSQSNGADGDLWGFANLGSAGGKRLTLGINSAESFTFTTTNFGIGKNAAGTSATKTFMIGNGTAPASSPTDCFQQYSADITAGNAAPHFRTENGNIIKLYRETTAVTASTFVTNTSGILNDTATFDGYTIGQVVKALRNLGILA